MKRFFMFAILIGIATIQLSSQILVMSNGDTIKFEKNNPLKQLVPQKISSDVVNFINFVLQDGSNNQFYITELDKLLFADTEETAIESIKANKETIIYNAETERVYVPNAKSTSELWVFNTEGKCVRAVNNSEVSLSGLPSGLYIISYNKTLNVKVLKK